MDDEARLAEHRRAVRGLCGLLADMGRCPWGYPVRASIHRLFGDYSYEVIVETSYILIIIAVVAWLRGGLSASFDDLGLSKSAV